MKQNEHTKRKHSDFAASSSHRWMNCAASVRLSRMMKGAPEKESPYAIEGTRAHECLEFIVKRFGNLATAEKEALKTWPKDMVQHALNSAKIIFKLKPSGSAKLLVEQRVVLKHIGPGLFGTLDYAWVDLFGDLIIIDFKYGAGVPVLPIDDETGEENSQLMYYASGIAARYDYEFAKVSLAIVQPRVWREDEDPLTIGNTTIKRLRAFEKKVKEAVLAAKDPTCQPVASPPEAADNWCRWCPAASFCPAISKAKMAEVDIQFDVETGLDEDQLPEIAPLNEETLGKVLNACDSLEVWIEKVRAHAFQVACQGKKIPGHKLVEKRSIRFWKEGAEVFAKSLFGTKAYSKPELLSPAQLEKAVGKAGKQFTQDYTDNKSSGVTLVKASDKREEVSSEVIEFATEEGEDSVFPI